MRCFQTIRARHLYVADDNVRPVSLYCGYERLSVCSPGYNVEFRGKQLAESVKNIRVIVSHHDTQTGRVRGKAHSLKYPFHDIDLPIRKFTGILRKRGHPASEIFRTSFPKIRRWSVRNHLATLRENTRALMTRNPMPTLPRPPLIPYNLSPSAKAEFVAYLQRLDDQRLRNTLFNYTFLAQHGGDRERFCRDACAAEVVNRGLEIEP